jgi:hypothetical protein
MDFETVLENCLGQYSPVRPKDLMNKLHERKIDVSRSKFYRFARKLEKANKLERKNGIWYFKGRQNNFQKGNMWDSLKEDLAGVGGYLTKIEFERLRLGDKQDPITGWYETFFEKETIKGIMILKGAMTMQTAAKLFVPYEYAAFLLTQDLISEGDRLIWQTRHYKVEKVEEIYDGYYLSYRVAKLSVFLFG